MKSRIKSAIVLKKDLAVNHCIINTSFYEDGMTNEGFHCVCLSVVFTDSVFKIGKNNIQWCF